MALTTRLDLRQTQTLVMTPQLQQAIKLLQISSTELSTFVEAELEKTRSLSATNPKMAHRLSRQPMKSMATALRMVKVA